MQDDILLRRGLKKELGPRGEFTAGRWRVSIAVRLEQVRGGRLPPVCHRLDLRERGISGIKSCSLNRTRGCGVSRKGERCERDTRDTGGGNN